MKNNALDQPNNLSDYSKSIDCKIGLSIISIVVCFAASTSTPASAAAPVVCVEAARPPYGEKGNRSCSSDDEKAALDNLVESSWKKTPCGLRQPLSWQMRKDKARPGGAAPIIFPNSNSLFAQFNFVLEAGIVIPDEVEQKPVEEKAEDTENESITQAEPIDGSEEETGTGTSDGDQSPSGTSDEPLEIAVLPPPNGIAPSKSNAESENSPQIAVGNPDEHTFDNTKNWVRVRYLTIYPDLEDVGADIASEDVEILHISHTWQSVFEYKGAAIGDEYGEFITYFACSSKDDMSIETFSSLCTRLIERSTLNRNSKAIGECPD